VNRNRGIWIALLLVVLGLCLCCVLLLGVFFTVQRVTTGSVVPIGLQTEATEQFGQQLQVEGPADVFVDVPVGNIEIRTGPGSLVAVEGTKHAWAATSSRAQQTLDDIQVDIRQSGSRVEIEVSGLERMGGARNAPRVDLTITVPEQTTLSVDAKVGAVSVTGTRGDATIKADVGDVVLRDVIPAGQLTVESRVASIVLTGALAAGANYELTSDIGRISMELPSDSSFVIDARSDIGNVNIDFPVSGRSDREGIVGKEVRGEVGDSPSSRLTLRSRVGDISVRPQ
jgi:hypothetical protein